MVPGPGLKRGGKPELALWDPSLRSYDEPFQVTFTTWPAPALKMARPLASPTVNGPLPLTLAVAGSVGPPAPSTATRMMGMAWGGAITVTGTDTGGVRLVMEMVGAGAGAVLTAARWARYSSPTRPSITSVPCSSIRARWKYWTVKPCRRNGSDVG